jgi:hypothetical protein
VGRNLAIVGGERQARKVDLTSATRARLSQALDDAGLPGRAGSTFGHGPSLRGAGWADRPIKANRHGRDLIRPSTARRWPVTRSFSPWQARTGERGSDRKIFCHLGRAIRPVGPEQRTGSGVEFGRRFGRRAGSRPARVTWRHRGRLERLPLVCFPRWLGERHVGGAHAAKLEAGVLAGPVMDGKPGAGRGASLPPSMAPRPANGAWPVGKPWARPNALCRRAIRHRGPASAGPSPIEAPRRKQPSRKHHRWFSLMSCCDAGLA